MTDDSVRIARSYNEAVNARNWDRVRQILAPNVTATSHSSDHVSHGPEEIIAALQKTTGLVEDTRLEVINEVAGPDQAVLELRLTGMTRGDPNTGQAGDPNASARRVSLPTCHVYQMRDGQIVSYTTYSDRRWR